MCSEPHRSTLKQAIFKKSPENLYSVPKGAINESTELVFTVLVIHVTKQSHISYFKIFLIFAIFGQELGQEWWGDRGASVKFFATFSNCNEILWGAL